MNILSKLTERTKREVPESFDLGEPLASPAAISAPQEYGIYTFNMTYLLSQKSSKGCRWHYTYVLHSPMTSTFD
ncbi:hypothetical protein Mapa_006128 [Marchantia paleacea]|nr:hypothetical protein Mapa_006128 [Marchantia paleacea]